MEKLREYLTDKNLKSAEFAALIGCSAPTVSRILSGKRHPSPSLARKIEVETGGVVTIGDLFQQLPLAA
ncbi:helix-turn-helix domain-containing protein [Pseudovibrio ascidiaceicola]|uniref:helix-turn-helix transcriptional regulator n=1 Tax=Pseudovibrio ascidiaceicola TaxID=285279 RepID=UPI000D69E0EC